MSERLAYLIVGGIGLVIMLAILVVNSMTLDKLRRETEGTRWRVPLRAIILNEIAIVTKILWFLVQLFYDIFPSADHFEIINLVILVVSILCYLFLLLYILFCWIEIVIARTLSFKRELIMKFRRITFAIVFIWTVIWCIVLFLFTTNSILNVLGVCCISLVPVCFSIGFLYFGNKLRLLIKSLGKDNVKKRFQFKLNVLASVFVVAMDLCTVYGILISARVGVEASSYGALVSWLVCLLIPSTFVAASAVWAFHPSLSQAAGPSLGFHTSPSPSPSPLSSATSLSPSPSSHSPASATSTTITSIRDERDTTTLTPMNRS
eukprot:TRINITY_DN6931_c0_g2_i1.p1 TRINITY_DN6931_c0_g2~~TRINITY_DN6931_c0_g2_i1.p1  ORF type:complete len:320 (+),score=27.52 TRINITY_DN6931_c0_g2_i1:80-1039(+)